MKSRKHCAEEKEQEWTKSQSCTTDQNTSEKRQFSILFGFTVHKKNPSLTTVELCIQVSWNDDLWERLPSEYISHTTARNAQRCRCAAYRAWRMLRTNFTRQMRISAGNARKQRLVSRITAQASEIHEIRSFHHKTSPFVGTEFVVCWRVGQNKVRKIMHSPTTSTSQTDRCWTICVRLLHTHTHNLQLEFWTEVRISISRASTAWRHLHSTT